MQSDFWPKDNFQSRKKILFHAAGFFPSDPHQSDNIAFQAEIDISCCFLYQQKTFFFFYLRTKKLKKSIHIWWELLEVTDRAYCYQAVCSCTIILPWCSSEAPFQRKFTLLHMRRQKVISVSTIKNRCLLSSVVNRVNTSEMHTGRYFWSWKPKLIRNLCYHTGKTICSCGDFICFLFKLCPYVRPFFYGAL